MIPATLLLAGSGGQREARLAAHLVANLAAHLPARHGAALLLEGLPSGDTSLEQLPALQIVRLPPACLCCVGNLVLRVQLNRLLRTRPAAIFIAPLNPDHGPALRLQLQAADYARHLDLQADVCLI